MLWECCVRKTGPEEIALTASMALVPNHFPTRPEPASAMTGSFESSAHPSPLAPYKSAARHALPLPVYERG